MKIKNKAKILTFALMLSLTGCNKEYKIKEIEPEAYVREFENEDENLEKYTASDIYVVSVKNIISGSDEYHFMKFISENIKYLDENVRKEFIKDYYDGQIDPEYSYFTSVKSNFTSIFDDTNYAYEMIHFGYIGSFENKYIKQAINERESTSHVALESHEEIYNEKDENITVSYGVNNKEYVYMLPDYESIDIKRFSSFYNCSDKKTFTKDELKEIYNRINKNDEKVITKTSILK